MEKRRNQLILSLLSKKADPYKDENAIDFRWSGVIKTSRGRYCLG